MKILFVEPPKEYWFVMGEYLPPPLGLLQLAAFLEDKGDNWELEVLDCQAERVNWNKLEMLLESIDPDLVVVSALSTCNTHTVLRTVSLVKKVDPEIKTVVGGQHFTALAQESLEQYPEIDYVIRGEGELTLLELVKSLDNNKPPVHIQGLSYRINGRVIHNPSRPLIKNLDDLPLPGYHFVEDQAHRYHFRMMAKQGAGYALVEASRGCQYSCTFCSQWKFWGGHFRTKSPERVADEMEHLYQEYGISFQWLTDDNLGMGLHTRKLCEELIKRGLNEDLMWFVQARSDAITRNQDLLPKMRKAGNYWVLTGLERHDPASIHAYQKGIHTEDSRRAMDLLKDNDIFAQATFITGDRRDSHQSMENFREFVNHVDPDIAIFMILTPFPGTALYETAHQEGWLEDYNWSNYDMIHAVMPTEHLSREEVQEELYQCYRDYYGSMKRRVTGVFSRNQFKRTTYRYMAGQGLLQSLRDLI
jgi:anaerobic magnesium-protoporphyrin IX monomethyl ester cyclase